MLRIRGRECLIIQHVKPEDFIFATRTTTSVSDFVLTSFARVGMTLEFIGYDENEIGVIAASDNQNL
jgi:GDPmannose 4,6-dehydratase